jgi:hypothetical protein
MSLSYFPLKGAPQDDDLVEIVEPRDSPFEGGAGGCSDSPFEGGCRGMSLGELRFYSK